jgi:hypothetical protein
MQVEAEFYSSRNELIKKRIEEIMIETKKMDETLSATYML